MPRLTVRVSSPVAERTQLGGPAGKLLLFAKIYDVAPDGSRTLVNRLVSPTRVADVTAPIQLELPGVVHRYAAGHRLSLVLAALPAWVGYSRIYLGVHWPSDVIAGWAVCLFILAIALLCSSPGKKADPQPDNRSQTINDRGR